MSAFDDLFARSETRTKAKFYVRGLLADVARKNSWQLAEALNLPDPHPLQRLLNEADWEADAVQKRQRQHVRLQLPPAGVIVIDESGFVKKGKQSAGVAPQYCGRVGKVENCQVGVYLTYATPTGTVFLDRRLYLPKAWCEDETRRRTAAIPQDIVFQTKPQLAQAMLKRVWAEGWKPTYVTGDTVYGNSSDLRELIAGAQQRYVLGIGSQHHVWRGTTRQSVVDIAHSIPATNWEQLAFIVAETGPVWYEWAVVRITMPHDTIGEQWLLIRRTLTDTPDYDFFVSNAPAATPLTELAHVASLRHEVEQALEEAKGQLGLADYEVRTWHGWHRHMTLCFLAHTWLTVMSRAEREKKAFATLVEL
jgi:SRSO17 transposase